MITLDEIRDSLQGVLPSMLATCSPQGVPNVCYLSQVEYVDGEHLALSFQFFNKSRQNVLANPHAQVVVIDPGTAAVHTLSVSYLRTETAGPLFERMKANLAAIAHATGMAEIFLLRGSDVYRIDSIARMPGSSLPPAPRRNMLAALRRCCDALLAARGLGPSIDALLDGLRLHLGIEHSMLLVADRVGGKLYALGSRGYSDSGVGAEIPLGRGAVGVAAAQCIPVRLAHAAADYAYVRAIREEAARDPDWATRLELGIPFPGLPGPHSQLAVPIELDGTAQGVLYVESAQERRFSYEDEDALVLLARQFAPALREHESSEERGAPEVRRAVASAPLLEVKYFPANGSVFFDDEYLIRGVAGSICWKILSEHADDGRTGFSNRELRLDRSLGLPELADNLEARLVLLERRLRERGAGISIEKTERGRFRLIVERTLSLSQQADSVRP